MDCRTLLKIANECFIADSVKAVQLDSLAGVVSAQAQDLIQADTKTSRARWIGRFEGSVILTLVFVIATWIQK